MENTEKTDYSYIGHRITEVRRRLAAAAEHSPCGQVPELLLASKYATAEEMNYAAHCCGVHLFGENRVSALLEKYERLDRNEMELHFIGSLQTNKVKSIIGKVALIHSLDSLHLADTIERCSAAAGVRTGVLCEVNIGREPQKGGLLPEELAPFLDRIFAYPHLECRGLMTMAPNCARIEDYRKFFRETYRIFIDIFSKKLHNIDSYAKSPILSMGMSESYEIAAEEGATLVRVGRAVFRSKEEE